MPKELTHWIIARQAFDALDGGSETYALIREHYDLYLAGAVLPDTLLHLVRGPDARVALELADAFHDAAGNSYAPLIRWEEYSKTALTPETKACLLGVLCHMQADIVFHPFVYSISGRDDIGMHYRLETAIDCFLVESGATPPLRSLREIAAPPLRATSAEVCRALFDPQGRLSEKGAMDAFDLHCRYQGMYDRLPWKMAAALCRVLPVKSLRQQRHLFYPVFRSGGKICPEGEGGWKHPITGLLQKTDLNDLARMAVTRSAELFRRIDRHKSFKAALQDAEGENLLTGLYGVQKNEMKSGLAGRL